MNTATASNTDGRALHELVTFWWIQSIVERQDIKYNRASLSFSMSYTFSFMCVTFRFKTWYAPEDINCCPFSCFLLFITFSILGVDGVKDSPASAGSDGLLSPPCESATSSRCCAAADVPTRGLWGKPAQRSTCYCHEPKDGHTICVYVTLF